MIDAAKSGDKNRIETLLNAGHSPNTRDYSNTALIYASARGHEDVVRLLLQRGAEPNLTTHDGATALHFAIMKSYDRVVTLLLEAGANPNYPLKLNTASKPLVTSPLMQSLAPRMSPEGIKAMNSAIDIFKKTGISDKRLKAVTNNASSQADNLMILLKDLDKPGMVGKILNINNNDKAAIQKYLAIASHSVQTYSLPSIAIALIEHGADVNARGPFGSTPAIYASATGEREVLELLINKGADLEVQNIVNSNALFASIESGNSDLVIILLDNGVDTTVKRYFLSVLEEALNQEYLIKESMGHALIQRLIKLEKRSDVLKRARESSIDNDRKDITSLF